MQPGLPPPQSPFPPPHPKPVVSVADGLGLAHDARNLIAAAGLYCDLLSRPGVLKPKHAHYAAELSLLGVRSANLLQRLMLALAARPPLPALPLRPRAEAAGPPVCLHKPVSLREIAERCSGLLRGVAGGRKIELSFGPAAFTPIAAAEEDVERILINLVRNAAAALETCHAARPRRRRGRPLSRCEEGPRPISLLAGPPHPIRISIGTVDDPIASHRPHPFRHSRLTVEDSGCGMDAKQLARLLAGASPSLIPRGIGFQVVRELTAANGASLSARSAPGNGTCIQIEWPALIEWQVSPSSRSAAPTQSPQLPWSPNPVASTQSVHTSESRWTT
jgi:signal transduction histidine kinase